MEPGTVTLYAPLERRRPGPGPPRSWRPMSTSRRVARTSWARKTVVPNQAATAVAARLPSSLSSTGSPRLSPTNRDNACSTGSPAAASRRPLRSWVPTRVVRRADMTDLLNSEKAASKARDLLASRVTFIEKLADAAQGERRRP